MKKASLFAICLLGLTSLAQNVFAQQPIPDHCPLVADIQKEGLSGVSPETEQNDNAYVAYQISPYQTAFTWHFLEFGIMATDKKEALIKANKALTTLSGTPKPEKFSSGEWYCFYQIKDAVMAIAVIMPSFSDLKKIGNSAG
jgi:hypothetical protein